MAVICSAKMLRSYLLAHFIKRYINKLILLLVCRPLKVYQKTYLGAHCNNTMNIGPSDQPYQPHTMHNQVSTTHMSIKT